MTTEKPQEVDLLAELAEADCWCGRSHEECDESGGCRWRTWVHTQSEEAERLRDQVAELRADVDLLLNVIAGLYATARGDRSLGDDLDEFLDDQLGDVTFMYPFITAALKNGCAGAAIVAKRRMLGLAQAPEASEAAGRSDNTPGEPT